MTISETADEISSLIRTVFGSLLLAVVGYAGGWLYTHLNPDVRLQQKQHELTQVQSKLDAVEQQVQNQSQLIDKMSVEIESRDRRIVQLDTSLQLMKVDYRVAQIEVLHQTTHPESGELITQFTFQEIDKEGTPVDRPRPFQIVGDILYVDFWIVKFDDAFVEQAKLDRSTSICLFRRLFGEHQEPYQGYTLDDVGTRPAVYGESGVMSDLERRIWSDFWNIANDPARAAAMGIRAAHGEAVATRLRPGQNYRVTLRASDGLSIIPVQVANAPTAAPAT